MPQVVTKSGPIDGKILLKGLARCALQLRALGVTEQSTVLVNTADPLVALTLTFACGALGCTIGQLSAETLKHKQDDENLKIVSDNALLPLEGVTTLTVQELQSTAPAASSDATLMERIETYTPPSILFTFPGVTGIPKLVCVPSEDISSRAHPCLTQPLLPAFITLHGILSIAWTTQIIRELRRGSSLLLKYDPQVWQKHALGRVYASPAQILAFCERFGDAIKNKISAANVIGGPLSKTNIATLLTVFETVEYCYGASETGQVSSKVIVKLENANGGVGHVDPSDQRETNVIVDAPEGEIGLIHVKTRDMCVKYLRNSELTQRHLSGGVFVSGDFGYIDASGELFITGCEDDLINLGGEKRRVQHICHGLKAAIGDQKVAVFATQDIKGKNRLGLALDKRPADLHAFLATVATSLGQESMFLKHSVDLYFVSRLITDTLGNVLHKSVAQELTNTQEDASVVIERPKL